MLAHYQAEPISEVRFAGRKHRGTMDTPSPGAVLGKLSGSTAGSSWRDNRTRYRVRSSFQCQMSSGKLGLERALRIISSYPDFSLYLVLVPSLRTVRVLGRGKKSYSYGSFVFFCLCKLMEARGDKLQSVFVELTVVLRMES